VTTIFEHVKVFGERNSGTHYIASLLARNFHCRQLRGTADLPRSTLLAALKGLAPDERLQWRERLTDENIHASLKDNFGWKHGCVPFNVLKRRDSPAGGILFIVVHKHPADWLKSFFRKPYNSLCPLGKISFSEFIRRPWVASAKENLPHPIAKNPVDLWNTKHRSWLELRTSGYRALYFKNSDFLVSFEQTLAPMAPFLRRKRPNAPLINVAKVTKGSPESMDDLKRKYVDASPFDSYSSEDRCFVEKHIDLSVLEALEYSMNTR